MLGVGQRGQVIGERTGVLEGIGGHVRTDPGQQMITGEDDPGVVVGEAQVSRRVSRRPDCAQIPSRDVQGRIADEFDVHRAALW